MIYYLQPYANNLDIGKAYNENIKLLPKNSWICITDQDTLKFAGFADRVNEIVAVISKKDIVTCRTNRLRKPNKCVLEDMYSVSDINAHIKKYEELWSKYGTELIDTNVCPGMFMLFNKSLWENNNFIEKTVKFDTLFSVNAKRKGYNIKMALGLYIFHLYRWGKKEPENYLTHLFDKQKLSQNNI